MTAKDWQKIFLVIIFINVYLFWPKNNILAQNLNKIEITALEQFQTIAPGESLPINIKLLNMGGSGRVDVQLAYRVLDVANNLISEESETVAVETTASFIKQVKIPSNIKPGRYFLLADLKYADQEVPAIAKIPFQVEFKFLGLFLNQLAILGAIISVGIILVWLLIYFINRPRKIIISRFDYKKVPVNLKPYYELISDIILTMQLHLGDKAVKIANKIMGLRISDQGEVLEIKKEPAEIVTLLTVAFQKNLNYQSLYISQKAISQRLKISPSAQDKAEYKKTADLVSNVAKFFIKK
ncbi:MAG: hypothetical protein NTZ49_00070 [Candidatus Parcubacteria bacterium]|nr:hypothetical protein [Candidatus Parcubacteria bacterium]